MKNFFLFLFKKLLILLRDFDGFFSYYTSFLFKRRYKLNGKCNYCGLCCLDVVVYLSDGFWQNNFLQKLIIRWFIFVYNFELKEKDEVNKILVFKCNYLVENKCSIYKKRPYICRNYPRPRYFEKPVFLEKCSYKAELNS